MVDINKSLIVIPARGGSKGIPKKNIKKLNGKPLIFYSIDCALSITGDGSNICVSTDDKEIKDLVENYGLEVPFLRPSDLAKDSSTTREALLHALSQYNKKYESILLLQPTSPFRKVSHVFSALKEFNLDLDMVASVTESDSNPYYNLYEENEYGYIEKSKKSSFTRRQDLPKVWQFNGAIYVINVDSLVSSEISDFKKIKKIEMDKFSSIDIDDEFDWTIAEVIAQKK